jgi:isopenicillin N synthase-like dioxygenase
MPGVPIVDVGALVDDGPDARVEAIAREIDAACRDVGFFYVVGHGIDPAQLLELDGAARRFFALPEVEKAEIAMVHAGRAWRGWFPLGGELTSGAADLKEGLYFGAELTAEDPRVRVGTPLHGPNLFPRQVPELRPAVLAHLDAMEALGQRLLEAMALGLGLERSWFAQHLTVDPLVLFRIFRYPPVAEHSAESGGSASGGSASGGARWGVAEHTDYGLLTLLGQDELGGLEVNTSDGWQAVDPIPGGFVCNLGDMLERLTRGRYRSTPHRVRNEARRDRLSFPFFLDPSWDATIDPLPIAERPADPTGSSRWDHASVHDELGTYGEYIMAKVAKVFPELATGAAE